MEEKIINLDAFKRELQKRKLKEKAAQVWEFCKEHPAESFALATTAVGGLFGLAKRADRKRDIREQQRLKDEYIYDHSIGRHVHLRRKPTNREYLEIERRRGNGERMGSILEDMRLL